MNTLQDVFKKRKGYKRQLQSIRKKLKSKNKIEVPDGLYEKCPGCEGTLLKEDIIDNYFRCPECNYHLKINAYHRIIITVDKDTFWEQGVGYVTTNPCNHEGYINKIKELNKTTELEEAFVYGVGKILGEEAIIGVLDSYFLMGSMGSVVGEKIAKAFEFATSKNLPIIIFSASGGARMQEGLFSLMQMAKTSQAVKKYSESNNLYISILTNPTYGGVTASFAMLGDIIVVEKDAMVGFAGPRVIKETIKEELPENFQSSQFLLEKGFVDFIIDRKDIRQQLSTILKLHKNKR